MPECGTYAALSRHKRLGEPVDDACRAAGATYQRERRSKAGPEGHLAKRIHRRAYQRALGRLRDTHRGQFAAILHEEVTRARADALLAVANAGLDDSWREDP